MNPLFTIESWELPPDCDTPLTASADFVFRSLWHAITCDNSPGDKMFRKARETEIWARRVAYKDDFLLFICDGENPSDGNWYFCGFNSEVPVKDWDSRYLSKKLRERFFWQCNGRRFVYFDAAAYGFPGPHYLIMFPGVCIQYNVNRYDTAVGWDWQKIACFHTPFGVPDTLSSFRSQKTELLSLFEDEESDAHFALYWLHATHEQQRAKVIHCQRGDLVEMQRLLRAALIIESDLWEDHTSLCWETRDWWEEKAYNGPKEDHLSERGTFPPSYVHEIPPRLNQWKKIIWNFFRPQFRPDLFRLAMSASATRTDIATITVEVSAPSEHERIKELLMLRSWWQDEFTPRLFGSDSNDIS